QGQAGEAHAGIDQERAARDARAAGGPGRSVRESHGKDLQVGFTVGRFNVTRWGGVPVLHGSVVGQRRSRTFPQYFRRLHRIPSARLRRPAADPVHWLPLMLTGSAKSCFLSPSHADLRQFRDGRRGSTPEPRAYWGGAPATATPGGSRNLAEPRWTASLARAVPRGTSPCSCPAWRAGAR